MAESELGLTYLFYTTKNVFKEILMPRFYFNLASKDAHIADDFGKELGSLRDAYVHALSLVHKILFRVGNLEAEAWRIIVLNDQHDAQMIVPFSVSHSPSHMRLGLNAKKPDRQAHRFR